VLQENFDLTINFDLFSPNSLGFPHVISMKFRFCGRFMNFISDRKILTLVTFGCPTYYIL